MPGASRSIVSLLILVVGSACGGRQAPSAGREDAPAPSSAPRIAALAEARAEWPELTVQVVEASRVDAALVVRFVFANTAAQPFAFGDRFAADAADSGTLADVAVMEVTGLRKYFVLRDRQNRPECSRELPPLGPGERRALFARFPAPPAGTSRITIQIPHVPDMQVPVSGGGGQAARTPGS